MVVRLLKSRRRKLKKAAVKEELTETAVEAIKKELKECRTQIKEQVKSGEFDGKYSFSPLASQQLGNKVRAFYVWRKDLLDEFRLMIGYSNNSLELWGMHVAPKAGTEDQKVRSADNLEVSLKKIQAVGWWGHQSPIRVCLISGNDQLLLTASTGMAGKRNDLPRVSQGVERGVAGLHEEPGYRERGQRHFPPRRQVRRSRLQGGLHVHR